MPAKKRKPAPQTRALTITALGARGDGIAATENGSVYVPYTLPGDRVTARVSGERGTATEFIEEAPRAAPVCRHFGTCGGCLLQHMPEAAYQDWKRRRIVDALAKKGFTDPPVAEPAVSPPHSRRRAVLSFTKKGGGVTLGYHAHRRHSLVDVAECPILTPALEGMLCPLRDALTRLSVRTGKVMLTDIETGVDLALGGLGDLTLADREILADLASARDLARIAVAEGETPDTAAEPLAIRRQPRMQFGDQWVALPPAAFLQATRAGEAALTAAVLEWADGDAVADLFAGCGTFSLPLSATMRVYSADSDAASIGALTDALKTAPHRTEQRDLLDKPLSGPELAGFDTVVLDPPRAGAKAQAAALADSAVPRIIAVSCNPATFARDARILADGGYALRAVRPVDQFLWSPHVEMAALFTRS